MSILAKVVGVNSVLFWIRCLRMCHHSDQDSILLRKIELHMLKTYYARLKAKTNIGKWADMATVSINGNHIVIDKITRLEESIISMGFSPENGVDTFHCRYGYIIHMGTDSMTIDLGTYTNKVKLPADLNTKEAVLDFHKEIENNIAK